MKATWIQLWVERLAQDPAAWTATHTLQLLLGKDAPQRVGRAELWELRVEAKEDGPDAPPLAERFETWVRGSNLFVNPSRDRGVVLGGVAPLPGPAVALVAVVDRGGGESRAHAITLAHALGGTWRARRGTVWTLAWPPEREADVNELAEKAAWAQRRSSGLLVNAESQDAVVLVGRWDCPVLPGSTGAVAAEV